MELKFVLIKFIGILVKVKDLVMMGIVIIINILNVV